MKYVPIALFCCMFGMVALANYGHYIEHPDEKSLYIFQFCTWTFFAYTMGVITACLSLAVVDKSEKLM